MTDKSAVLMPSIEYSFTDNILMMLKYQAALGDKKKSEYGSMFNLLAVEIQGFF